MEKYEYGPTITTEFFGDTPFWRLVDEFIAGIHQDFSKKEITEIACVSKAATFKHWPKLVKYGLIKPTRRYGKAQLYTLNRESKLVKALLQLEWELIDREPLPTKTEQAVAAPATKAK
ncbi:MAG TPA: hypothetical protein HA252_05020 [Candidatus Diapherotrites archaeon]|uniref:Winged helix-turn-helix transcriptional regulator n=1 Tax=Candidatus Iainarchaeum sp. TaxID=3101447 RepID=A0A7J4JG37_9ARCH|nr:hypothetical protein [Candidatus Diapherotrites archaeon]HIH16741.1 hypothetical protein [Candidatus Diapherotrites archaeon]